MKETSISSDYADKNVLKLEFLESDLNSHGDQKIGDLGNGWKLEIHESLDIVREGEKVTSIEEICFSSPDWNEGEKKEWMSFEHKVSENSKIFGLGEKTGQLDKSGLSYKMWNTDVGGKFPLNEDPMYLSIPFYIVFQPEEEKFFGIYVQNPGESKFDIKYKSGRDRIGVAVRGSSLKIYIITGESLEEILEEYTDITGKPFMPPRWALGYQHSKYGYPNNREETLELAEKFREYDMPCDVLYFDIQFMKDYKVFQWDEERFENHEELLEILHKRGFKIVNIIEPGVKAEEGFSIYDEGKERGVFVENEGGDIYKGSVYPGFCAFPDFFDPEAQEWWSEKNKEFLQEGVDGLWNDMNEPAIFYGKKDLEKVNEEISNHLEGEGPGVDFLVKMGNLTLSPPENWINNYNGEKVDHEKVHNKYGFYEDRAAYKAFQKLNKDVRPFILSRSGFAGFQKYATAWTGDNASSWEDMRQSIPMLLNLGLSGVPFVGPDVGGFAGDVGPELLTRWMQLGAFYPFYRNHSMIGTAPQEPWIFDEPYRSINRKFLKLRYKILPYLYTLMYEAHETGKPLMRPLFMEFPEDESSRSVQDEFMLGSSLLVAPVLEKGKEEIHVYLPHEQENSIEWKDWWSGEIYESGHNIVESPLERIPLFIREGRGVPIFDKDRKNTEEIPEKLAIKAHVKQEARVPIYWDDGKTRDFKKGGYFSGGYAIKKDDKGFEVSLEKINGGYELPWNQAEVV